MDRISKEITPLGTIDYTYDKNGRRITMLVAGQPVVNYIYDDAGRMTSMNRKIGTKTRTHTFTFDNANRRTQLKLALSQANKYVTTTYGYDIANRLLSMLIQGPTVQIENLVYTYDENANRTKFTRNATQPVREGVTSATYDNANEMLTFTPVTSPAKTMTYDNNGNLLTSTNAFGTTTYTWDVRNRLIAISGPGLTASFQYDAIGRRISKTINGTTTQFLYDGLDIIQEKQGRSVSANYIRTLNINEPLTRIKADGTVRHYVKDALGSIIALTDDTGATKTTYTYDAFGQVTQSGEATDNPFQFVAKENDGTGLIREGFRYYSPELQRYISEDLIRLDGGNINFYVRTRNDPINRIDPVGLEPYQDAVTVITSALDVLSAYSKLPTNPANAISFAIGILADKTNAIIALAPDSNTKSYIGTGLSAISLGAALAGEAPVSVFLSGYGFGTAIYYMPVEGLNTTVGEWWVDKIYDALHPKKKEPKCRRKR